jgi:long-chain fatty acid transport protein
MAATLLLEPIGSTMANGIYRNGAGARSMSLGGADVAWAQGPLSALALNPAGLSSLARPTLELSGTAAAADGEFTNAVNHDGHLQSPYGFIPEFAWSAPLGSSPVTLGLALIPEALLSADWLYLDTSGGLGGAASYGLQQHHAEIALLRSALGVSVALGPKLSVGASFGLLYNRNTLQAPYIFQNQPILKGFKTMLDLGTDGFGYNGQFGVLFRPHEALQLGLAYTLQATLHTQGDASGNASAQLQSLGEMFTGVRPDFHYDAEVINAFPQVITGGLSWRVHPKLRLAGQVDWIGWAHAFDRLQINLTHGNNADLNALVGSSSVEDAVPLNWHDRFVYRAGAEFSVSENVRLRGGYAYGKSPVPEETLTPLTAAILEHTLSAGIGYRWGRCDFDLAYQYELPKERSVGVSGLRSGEYSNSRVEVGIHWVGFSTAIRF